MARYLCENLNYGHIELDDVVHNVESDFMGGQKFVEICRHRNDIKLVHSFVALTRNQIHNTLGDYSAVIFEGALANNETLSEVVSGYKFLFVYLLPINLDIYLPRVLGRFQQVSPDYNAGLPPAFWKHIDHDALDGFYQTKTISPELRDGIEAYASESMREARVRLDMFAQHFKDIFVVEI